MAWSGGSHGREVRKLEEEAREGWRGEDLTTGAQGGFEREGQVRSGSQLLAV